MNTQTNRFTRRRSAMICVQLGLLGFFVLSGCKKEPPKTYPYDRLTVEYTIDRDTIHVGDPVELIVTAHYPTNGVLKLPEIGRGKEIVLLERNSNTEPRADGLSRSETRYSITSFHLGEYMVSTNMISCRIGEQLYTTNFPAVTLHVQTALSENDTSRIEDIKPVQDLPGRIPRWLWVVVGSAILAFVVGLITAKCWKSKIDHRPPAPSIPPHVLALNALLALMQKGLLERDECKPFYTELSLILRTYLEGRFHLNAPDQTTDEIVEEMSRSVELSGAQRNILQDFMRQADMVKFAKGHPDRRTMEAAYKTTKQFVEETKQDQTATPDQTHPN